MEWHKYLFAYEVVDYSTEPATPRKELLINLHRKDKGDINEKNIYLYSRSLDTFFHTDKLHETTTRSGG